MKNKPKKYTLTTTEYLENNYKAEYNDALEDIEYHGFTEVEKTPIKCCLPQYVEGYNKAIQDYKEYLEGKKTCKNKKKSVPTT